MPISLWLKWKAWFKLQGPPGGLGDDLRSALAALEAAKPYIVEEQRLLVNFLPPGRRPSDYAGWIDFGEDAEQRTVGYSVE